MTTSKDMPAAIRAWRGALGEDKAASDSAALDSYSRTTLAKATRPCCVLYPTSTEEVQQVVRIANEHGVVLYPVSRGKNWGYGDACAPSENAAIVDLTRMNRIVEVNVDLAYAVIEPGVSQAELHEYLQANNTGLWMDCTGAGRDASLVGNTLDRGFGHTRYGDHFATACGMEAVLADGRVLNTGYSHYPNAQSSHVYRYGVGPFLDGLFCQSNYGIVTKIGLWLMPKPEAFSCFAITVPEDEKLELLIDRIRPLRMAGIVNAALHIGNDLRILSSRTHYPWDLAQGVTPLPEHLRKQMREELAIGAWTAAGAITGTKGHVRASKRALRQALSGLGTLRFVGDNMLALGEWVVGKLGTVGLGAGLRQQLTALRPVYDLLQGKPNDDALHGAQWRLRQPPGHASADPLESGCGLIWISPVVPMTGKHAREVLQIVEPIFAAYRFEPLATFTMINERAMIGILNMAFDRNEEEEATRAEACYHDVTSKLVEAGYIPYRVSLAGMEHLQDNSVFWEVATAVKRTLDPKDIIARGRYIPPLA